MAIDIPRAKIALVARRFSGELTHQSETEIIDLAWDVSTKKRKTTDVGGFIIGLSRLSVGNAEPGFGKLIVVNLTRMHLHKTTTVDLEQGQDINTVTTLAGASFRFTGDLYLMENTNPVLSGCDAEVTRHVIHERSIYMLGSVHSHNSY